MFYKYLNITIIVGLFSLTTTTVFSQEQSDSTKLLDSTENTKITKDTICIDGECYKINEHNPWEHYYQLPDITVYGNRLTSLLTASTEYIPSYEITQKAESSILPVLKEQVPGLFINSQGVAGYGVSSGASGNITMRGFSGSAGRLLILIDGHPQYAPIYGHPMADTYTTDNIESVEVIRGAASVLYGSNAMGGAINFITKQQKVDGNQFRMRAKYGSYATTNCMISDGFKHNNLTLFASGNHEHSDGYRENSEFNSLNGFAKVGYKLNKNWNIATTANISHFDIEMPGPVSAPLNDCEANITRGIYSLLIDNNYRQETIHTWGDVDIYYNWGSHQINDGYKEGGKPQEYLFHSTDYMGGINVNQSLQITNTVLQAGFNFKRYGGNAYRNPVTEKYADHLSFDEVAEFVLLKQYFVKKEYPMSPKFFFVETGIRMEHHSLYGSIPIPMAGLAYKRHFSPTKSGTKYWDKKSVLSYSKGFRTPNMRELYMYAAANENLLPEHCHNFEYSFTNYITEALNEKRRMTKLNIYHNRGANIVQTVMVDGKPQNQNVGKFKNTGVEFVEEFTILKHYNDMQNIRFDYSYIHMEQPIMASPRQKMGFQYKYTLHKEQNFEFSLGIQYIEKLYLAVDNEATKEENEEKTKSFALVDGKVSIWGPKSYFKWFIQCEAAPCKGDYETMLGYPLPKVTCSAGVSVNFP